MASKGDIDEIVCVELRWFVDGDVGRTLVHRRKPDKRRVDSYHLGSLTETSAWKRRGRRGVLEWKARDGSPHPVTIDGLAGVAERWVKLRNGERPPLDGRWIEVSKQIWLAGDWQICRVVVAGMPSWSVAVQVDESFRHPALREEVEAWWPHLRAEGVAASYPTWLIASHADDAHDSGCHTVAV